MIRSGKTRVRALAAIGAATGLLLASAPAVAGPSILDDWSSVKMPPPPEVKPVAVDSAHTALLILDITAALCTEKARPRCIATLPAIARLLADARAHKMMVIYSAGAVTPTSLPPDPVAALAPLGGEPMMRAPVDKFYNTDMEKILAAKNITTVIVTGTSADGAVLYSASSAAIRNLTVIVPVDGMSSANPFSELYTAFQLKNAPGAMASHITLTKTDMIAMH